MLDPHSVELIGLLVGFGLGVIPGLYLHFVSPFDHGWHAKLNFLGLGTATVLLSAEPTLQAESLVVEARVLALGILASLQMALFARLLLREPLPTPRQAMMIHLCDAGLAEPDEDLSVVQMYRRAFHLD
jgi:hypothetical protein